MAATRPFRSEYRNSKGRIFKVGRASTVDRAVVAAARTLIDMNLRSAWVQICNQHGVEKGVVQVQYRTIKINKWR